jgi:hypothetical protein
MNAVDTGYEARYDPYGTLQAKENEWGKKR